MTVKVKRNSRDKNEVDRVIAYLSERMDLQLQHKIEDVKTAFKAATDAGKLPRPIDRKKLEALAEASLIHIPVEDYLDFMDRHGLGDAQDIDIKLREVKSGFRLTDSELAKLFGISLRTFGYWKSGRTKRPMPLSKERLDKVFEIYRELAGVLKSLFLRKWLFEPGKASGDAPYDLLVKGRFEKVHSEIEALKEGVYA
jgi:transcriptional regulator with XRE-family HTH domain